MTTKNIVILGQSNELAFATNNIAPTGDIGRPRVAQRGCPVGDPMTPNSSSATSGYKGSAWPKLAEMLFDNSGDWINIYNTGIGATSFSADWCGDDGAGNVYTSADGGWDQNGYLAIALDYAARGAFDERWAFVIVTGQRDSTLSTPLLEVQAGLENITNYFLDNNIKVALGMTSGLAGATTWYTNNGQAGLDAAIATFSGNSNVIIGGNMWEKYGASVPLLADGAHMQERGFDVMSRIWYNALITAGW